MFSLCGEIKMRNSVDDDMSPIFFSANSTFSLWLIQHQFNSPFILVGLCSYEIVKREIQIAMYV